MERHVGRHCGRDFKLPWQRRWPLGWPESTKALFFLGFLFVNCLVACSEFNLSSHGHSEKKLTRFAWQYGRFWRFWIFGFNGHMRPQGHFFSTNRCAQWIPDVILHPKKYSQAIFLNLAKKLTRPYCQGKAGPVQFVYNGEIQHMAHFRIKIKDCLVKLH